MRKKVTVFVLFIILLISLHFVSSAYEDHAVKGYQCLQDRVKTCVGLTTEQQAFTLLALRDLETCKTQLKANQGTTIKQKALSLIALKEVGEDTTNLENNLLSQKIIPPGINWYLQVETKGASTCQVSYDGHPYTFNLADNKKLSGSGGSCLTIAADKGNYWFKINSLNGCQEKSYEISCDNEQGFLTNLLYQDPASSTIFVSDKTHTAPGTTDLGSKGRTTEKINSFCLKKSSTECDYEGTLWASVALDSPEHYQYVNALIPYLMAKAPANEKYFPSTFIYFLTDLLDYRAQVLGKQGVFSGSQYFSSTQFSDKLYDTALALFFLSQDSAVNSQRDSAQKWLIDNQDSNGCWGKNSGTTITDTAFILLSSWPSQTPQPEEPEQNQCDAPSDCVNNPDFGEGYSCNLTTHTCYQPQQTGCTDASCLADHGTGWICDSATKQCVDTTTTNTCQTDSQCTNSSIPRCFDGLCRECKPTTQDVDCGAGEYCESGQCTPIPNSKYCGDVSIDKPNSNGITEECDGTTRGGATDCVSLDRGYTGGGISCYSPGTANECMFNVTLCYNETIDACTSNDNCTVPNSSCNLVTGICEPPNSQETVCGNGILETGEDCDGTIFRNNLTQCTDFDKDYGNVTCGVPGTVQECIFNLSQCKDYTGCTTNADCQDEGEGYECDDYTGECSPPQGNECTWPSDCLEDETCEYGTCVPYNGGDDNTILCIEDRDYYCRSSNTCTNDGGTVLTQFECTDLLSKCCSIDAPASSCTAQSGQICNSNQDCSGGNEVYTSDLSSGQICCTGGVCVAKSTSESYCEYFNSDGQCKTSCGSGEVSSSDDCTDVYGSGYICCVSEAGTVPNTDPSYLWLWILLILIVLVVLGILFREKLRVLLMRVKSKFGKGGQPPRRPGFPPPSSGPQRRPILRRILPPQSGPPQRQPPMPPRGSPPPTRLAQTPPKKEEKPKSDLDDVLKKLKDMGN